MGTIYLVRHGETDWNAQGKLQGHTDIPLNEAGRAQARDLAAKLRDAGITHVTTSDLSRARETGAIAADALGVASRAVEPALRERRFGVFEGLTREQCATLHPEAWRAWVEQTSPPDGAELPDAAIERVAAAVERELSRHPSGASLVVSHGGVMRLFLQSVVGAPLPLIANGMIYVVSRDGDVGLRAVRWGE